jgi:hypothetical protein
MIGIIIKPIITRETIFNQLVFHEMEIDGMGGICTGSPGNLVPSNMAGWRIPELNGH